MELDGGIYLSWDVAETMFPAGMPGDMFASFRGLVEKLANEAGVWDSPPLSLLPPSQTTRRTEANCTTQTFPRQCIHSGFLDQAQAHPDRVGLIDGDRRLTYGEVALLAGDVAREIRSQGIQPNQLVAIVMEKGWEQAVAALGVTLSGGAYLPIEAGQPEARILQLLELGEANLVLTQSRWARRIAWPASVLTICVDAIEASTVGQAFRLPGCPATPDDLAYVIFTSGSTGLPKGVMITHHAAVNTILDINERFAVGPADRTLALSSLSFDLSVYDIFGLLAAGGAVVFPDGERTRDPQYLHALIEHERITIWNSVPSYMQMLVEGLAHDRADTLRLVMLSGDWIPVGLPPRIRALSADARVVSMGGATEASIWSIWYPIEEVDRAWKSIPYGKPLANQSFFVFNADLGDCPDGVPGELYIGGDGVAAGYWRDETKTAASFVRHPVTGARLYRTGDWGAYLPDGNIEFLGRHDLQVKIGGFRIELGEIDAALAEAAGITAVLTVAYQDEGGHKRLAAFYVNEPNSAIDTPRSSAGTWRKRSQPT